MTTHFPCLTTLLPSVMSVYACSFEMYAVSLSPILSNLTALVCFLCKP
jgi:hypothetical protein